MINCNFINVKVSKARESNKNNIPRSHLMITMLQANWLRPRSACQNRRYCIQINCYISNPLQRHLFFN